jgi:hypothetical protein
MRAGGRAEEEMSMSKIAVLPILLSLACAVNARAELIGTMDCQGDLSSCNSKANVESLLGQDVELVWESAGGIVPAQIAVFDDSAALLDDPLASDSGAGSQLFGGGGGLTLFASFNTFHMLNLFGGSSWSFPFGTSGIKIWRCWKPCWHPCSAIPEPSSALVFALGFGMVSSGIRKRTRRQ